MVKMPKHLKKEVLGALEYLGLLANVPLGYQNMILQMNARLLDSMQCK